MNNLISIVTEFVGVRVFTSNLNSGYLSAGVVIIMNSSLARHVCKVSEMLGRLLSIKLLFKNKLSVLILGLYADASAAVGFFQADVINSLIARAVNESFFVVLGGDFNENGSRKCASFKKCLDLRLVNSLVGSQTLKMPTWVNSRGVQKTIDFMFVSSNLVNALVYCDVLDVSKHFNMDHQTVSVSLESSRFHKLELLVSRIIKASHGEDVECFDSFMRCWNSLDDDRALVIQSMITSDVDFGHVYSALLGARKFYCASKLAKSQCAKKANIRSAINKKIESFEVNKSYTIRSIVTDCSEGAVSEDFDGFEGLG
ncbi:hypothetical protein G9A89_012273 [Geosiphon pyriformis]|nr:hypothetical protein G9A89_012273 [Geosiphon pyriformis]